MVSSWSLLHVTCYPSWLTRRVTYFMVSTTSCDLLPFMVNASCYLLHGFYYFMWPVTLHGFSLFSSSSPISLHAALLVPIRQTSTCQTSRSSNFPLLTALLVPILFVCPHCSVACWPCCQCFPVFPIAWSFPVFPCSEAVNTWPNWAMNQSCYYGLSTTKLST
jgi:hypothetical protein